MTKRWTPKEGERYWYLYIEVCGSLLHKSVVVMKDTYNVEFETDGSNCFRTKREAEVVRRAVLKLLKGND